MFVIVVYDISSKRVSKVMKVCRKYLNHKQKSVFEGMITNAQLERMKRELGKIVDTKENAEIFKPIIVDKVIFTGIHKKQILKDMH